MRWIGDSFRFGFVRDLRVDDRSFPLFDSPLAPYLRRLTMRGDSSYLTRVAREIARSERAWLAQLTVDLAVDDPIAEPTVEELIAATPRLEHLDVAGHRAFETFPHSALRSLRVTGWMALPKLLTNGSPTMTGVTALDLRTMIRTQTQPGSSRYRASSYRRERSPRCAHSICRATNPRSTFAILTTIPNSSRGGSRAPSARLAIAALRKRA